MPRIEHFGETRDVSVTVLVDNRADLMVESTETVKYFTDAPLLAEHGFAALLRLKQAHSTILWDAGITGISLMENMRRMEINPSDIDKIVISHGHRDHTTAVSDVLAAIDLSPESKEWPATATLEEMAAHAAGRRLPLIVHPAAFHERWWFDDDGKKHGPNHGPPRAEWEAARAEVITSESPYPLGPGCWSTGYVPRRSFENAGLPTKMYHREGLEFLHDHLDEDQAIVIHVRDKGLVVISGCAHAGILNTVQYAREISGVDRVWAIIGGFHLGRAKEDDIQRTIKAIKTFEPVVIVPSHCTGFTAIHQFAAQMPGAFVPGVVGATYLF